MSVSAQNYDITFTGTGESSNVSTVKVENLMSGTSLTLNGSDILRLTITTGVNSVDYKISSGLKVYPNPMTDNTILQFYPPEDGNAVITVSDFTGKPVAQSQSYLEKSGQEFRISGVEKGLYLINVRGNNYQFSGKLISNGKSNKTISIAKINNLVQATDEKTSEKESKGTQSTIDMAYNTGDRLKYTGISGIYSTVITDIPLSDKTIAFNFITCTDGDNNNYPVVKIGDQIWMAENLKTTKFNNNTTIALVTDGTSWDIITTPGYCWYNNDEAAFKSSYGALYNKYTVITGNLCPIGWHVSRNAEWTTLITLLSGDAGKLKETGVTHWNQSITGVTNETGFTALPAGYRFTGLAGYSGIGNYCHFWSPDESNKLYSLYMFMLHNTVVRASNGTGLSVRCIKDN